MTPSTPSPPSERLTPREVLGAWWPLAASWLLMGLELPLVSAMMARMARPTVSLAAYGGVVFPLALLIESPIIMMLSASTALCRDMGSYRLVRRFMFWTAGSLTMLHALVAFTPLYDVVVRGWMGAPAEILEPARRGLQIMLPWSLSIAYRRFSQGLLIRFGRPRAVSLGTLVRLLANVLVLAVGFALRTVPGIIVGTLAVAAGVVCEALFAGAMARPVVRGALREAAPQAVPLTPGAFLRFYVPLAMMPLIAFLAIPLASAAVSRMPRPIDSLATWPVVTGLVFTLRSFGFAMNEVVVSLLDRPKPVAALRRFSIRLAAVTTAALLLVAATPIGALWLGRVSALPPNLVALGSVGLWVCLLLPALSVFQSWFQGVIVHSRLTRGVTESVLLLLVTMAAVLGLGIRTGRFAGLHVALAAMVAGNAAQVIWLWWRARGVIRTLDSPAAAWAAAGVPSPREAIEPQNA